MITVTEVAKRELYRTLTGGGITDTAVGFRLDVQAPGEYSLVPDFEKEGDQVVEHNGSKVLLIDEELLKELEGIEIDCTETTTGMRFTMSNK
jgi:Fe-S cluster assembly iron-binding protein IscA